MTTTKQHTNNEARIAERQRLEATASWHDRQAVLARRNKDICSEQRHEELAMALRLKQR
jgi:hypothetical protein